MPRRKHITKVEYDNSYPPLKDQNGDDDDSNKPKQSIYQTLMSQIANAKEIIITQCDKRFKDNDPNFQKTLKDLCARLKIKVNLRHTNMGSLVIDVIPLDEKPMDHIKFIIRETFTAQKTKTFNVDNSLMKKLTDKKLMDKITENRVITVTPDYTKRQFTITGGRASVTAATQEIEEFISWNSNAITTIVEIPACYHDIIRGVDSKNIEAILQSSGKFVHARFGANDLNHITLKGNTRCVAEAQRNLLNFFNKLESSLSRISVELTPTQRSVLLKSVTKEVAVPGRVSYSITSLKNGNFYLDMVGEPPYLNCFMDFVTKIIKQFTSSTIQCPYWVCKYFTTAKECEAAFTSAFPNSFYKVYPLEEYIEVVCEDKLVSDAVKILSNIIEDISVEGTYDTLTLSDSIVKVLESNHRERLQNIEATTYTKLFFETDVNKLSIINIPINRPDVLAIIVGVPYQVKRAKDMLTALKEFYDSFVTVNLSIPSHLHKHIIGKKGKTLNEVVQNFGPNSSVTLGKNPENVDECTIKGPENEVCLLIKSLNEKVNEFKLVHHKLIITIPANISSIFIAERENIISALRQIGVVWSLSFSPLEKHVSGSITIIGPKDVVDKYEEFLNARIEKLSKSVTETIFINDKLVPILTLFGDAVTKAVSDDAGGDIDIQIPEPVVAKAHLSIFGPQAKVQAAKDIFTQLSGNSQDYYFDVVKVSKQHIHSLKSSIFELIGSSGVRVYFSPTNGKDNNNSILILGKNADVKRVKQDINKNITILKDTVEKTINIKAAYKKEFLKKRGDEPPLVQVITKNNPGVRIYLGDKVANCDTITVTMKGLPKDVDQVISTFQNLVREYDKRIEKQVQFTVEPLYYLLRSNKGLLRSTMDKYDVVISLSDNYYNCTRTNALSDKCTVSVRGNPDNVENAIAFIKEWDYVSQEVFCPIHVQRLIQTRRYEIHRTIVRELFLDMDYGAFRTPPEEDIIVSGLKRNVVEGVKLIEQLCDENFEYRIDVPEKYYTRLIGKQGGFIQKFNSDNNVKVRIPNSSMIDSDVVIFGKRQDCLNAAEKILNLVNDWDSTVTRELVVENEVRYRLFGSDRQIIGKLQRETKTIIRSPINADKESKTRRITVTGFAENVDKCVPLLLDEIDSIMDILEEQHMYDPPPEGAVYALDATALSSMIYGSSTKNGNKASKKAAAKKGRGNANGANKDNTSNNCHPESPHIEASP